MVRFVNTRLRARREDDGIALVASIALIGVVGILLMALVAVSLNEATATGRDRQRSAAVMTAEALVDQTVAEVQSVEPGSLPCGETVPDGVLADQLTVTSALTYYDTAGNPVDCADVATIELGSVKIVATSVSQPINGELPARRTVETLLQLTPEYAIGLDKAIFGDDGINSANNGTLRGNGGPNADIYSNGNIICQGQQTYQGSIFAQGFVRFENSCTAEVDVHARTGYFNTNHGVVMGDVRVSNGPAQMDKATIHGKVWAGTGFTATGDKCSSEKCISGQPVAPPPALEFPKLPWNATVQAQWVAQGYTNVVTRNGGCNPTGEANNPGHWLLNNAASLPADTILITDCQVKIQRNAGTLALNRNVVIVAAGGIDISNSLTIKSSSTELRNLYMIQPFGSSCSGVGIHLDNRVTFESTVLALLYSPCDIIKANQAEIFGQIYAGGEVSVRNKFDMQFKPLPVWGLETTTNEVEYYNVTLLYKRENV